MLTVKSVVKCSLPGAGRLVLYRLVTVGAGETVKLEVPLLRRKQFLVMPCELLKHDVAAEGSALYTAFSGREGNEGVALG